jgi:hypothetical protein
VRQNFLDANAVKNHLVASSWNYMRNTPRRKRTSPEEVSCEAFTLGARVMRKLKMAVEYFPGGTAGALQVF